MGQVCGKIKNHECEWISLEEQEKRFHAQKLADVYLGLGSENIHHELFDHQIAYLIADYAKMDDKWSKACKLFGQDKVPAFPEEHISEVGDPDSVFYLIPAGSLNEFEHKLRKYAFEVLGIDYLIHPLRFIWNRSLADKNRYFNTTSYAAKWVSMKRSFLPGRVDKNYKEQKALAKEMGIAIPSIQTIAKIILLDNAVQLSNAVEQDDLLRMSLKTETPDKIGNRIREPLLPLGTSTFVKQKVYGSHLYIVCIGEASCMYIGCNNQGSRHGFRGVLSYHTGLAVVREF